MHLLNQRPGKPETYPRVHTARQAIPRFNGETLCIKGDCRTPAERRGVESGGHGEHRVTVKKHTRIYPCCRKLPDRHKAQDMLGMITNKGIAIGTPSLL